jgi:hypothetical protein
VPRLIFSYLAVGALGLLVAFPSLAGSAKAPPGPGCSTTVKRAAPKRSPKLVTVRLSCAEAGLEAIEFDRLDLRPNQELRWVSPTPAVVGSEPDNALACTLGPSEGRFNAAHCSGELSPAYEARVNLKLKRPACRKPRFRVNAYTGGGPDCEEAAACPGYGVSVRHKRSISGCA